MTPARILVVEDDRIVAWDIQQQLSRIGHTVVGVAARGEKAVELALSTKPHLVLMDIRLEGAMDGIETAQEIRRFIETPIVFLTAYTDDETLRRASQAEPLGYLLKPFEDLQLRTVIEMGLHRHAAERKVRESARRYATTLASIGDAVITTDQQYRITFMNPAAEMLTGWKQNEIERTFAFDVVRLLDEETRADLTESAIGFLYAGVPARQPCNAYLIARDGREITVDVRVSPILDEDEILRGTVLVLRDMTQHNKMSQALHEAKNALVHVGRLAMMGEVSVSIAHEVNQPLMAIVTNAATCLQWLDEGQPDRARKAAERIIRDGHRAGDIIASIRALARKAEPEVAPINLEDAVREVLVLLAAELRHAGVTVSKSFSGLDKQVVGDRVQVQQVLFNLVTNSLEALSATKQETKLIDISIEVADPKFLLIKVADNGTGLDPATSERVFDPFFTTKPHGIGMGLAICRSIVEAHRGKLWAAQVASGATFCFTLPQHSVAGSYGQDG